MDMRAFPSSAESAKGYLESCPCASPSWCLPVALGPRGNETKKPEIFAFSVETDDRWKYYDWEKVTTVAWNVDKELMCHAHSKGVKIVVKHNFDDTDKLCDAGARRQWIQDTYEMIVSNYADGVNIDTEKPMYGNTARCQTQLVRELRTELNRHPLTRHAQITFDVSWAPRGVDGRYYEWQAIADVVDFLFVMSYDMRSQIYYQCIAAANSPLPLVRQGLEEFIKGFGIAPSKLVLGIPWYGYQYACDSYTPDNDICTIRAEPFFGAPCSDAAGKQINYGDIQRLVRTHGNSSRRWDALTSSPYLVYHDANPDTVIQLWYDDEESLRAKYRLVKELGLRGVGMWNADTLDYAEDLVGSQRMWDALEAAA
ncbi:hypothetical protein Poli38472_003398 [Pythium oligandrum]|uniref:GH18 domain-containing protein n=1 Tax=Pythium oligandrum TaxID=41045 RepID=A0A8K1C743_PYTOL|nr:hypothetical protein Poli38472_003398 [Pythium oligandrum]|eukprot:TMW57473.1 hypothetical protein Poli38472_003398 [Pythium oligandrum]